MPKLIVPMLDKTCVLKQHEPIALLSKAITNANPQTGNNAKTREIVTCR
jgi:hypothetical protein